MIFGRGWTGFAPGSRDFRKVSMLCSRISERIISQIKLKNNFLKERRKRMASYKIQKGDTLTSIAKKYNTTVDDLAAANNIKNKNLIYAGDTLVVPEGSSVVNQGMSSVVLKPDYSVIKGENEPLGTPSKAKYEISKWQKERPMEYHNTYSKEIDSLLDELLGKNFEYDPLSDAAFLNIRDERVKNARLAMEDTMGRAAALTGGYSNSYAQGAANQAYNSALGDISELIPELYSAAYDRYADEREGLADSIKLLSDMSDGEFDRYTEMMKLYLSEGEMLWDNYKDLTDAEFERFLDYASLLQKAAE
ncbi:MAG: LysM peptidoglycan-binding domain-containing protein [Ruminococcaceae bacterium]|nr:LysM peptidoglycan-binding domain-containing protein [Oscillospiraceae bacterium]